MYESVESQGRKKDGERKTKGETSEDPQGKDMSDPGPVRLLQGREVPVLASGAVSPAQPSRLSHERLTPGHCATPHSESVSA